MPPLPLTSPCPPLRPMLRCNQKGCLTSFAPLTHLPAFTTDGGRGALSHNVLGSVPEHAFWVLITESLRKYDWNYVFPYITISYASGQWFETAVWVCSFLSFLYLKNHLRVHFWALDFGINSWVGGGVYRYARVVCGRCFLRKKWMLNETANLPRISQTIWTR